MWKGHSTPHEQQVSRVWLLHEASSVRCTLLTKQQHQRQQQQQQATPP
jgi:hypothetical protein